MGDLAHDGDRGRACRAVAARRGLAGGAEPVAVHPAALLGLALPVAARNAFVAFLLMLRGAVSRPLATIVYAVWVVAEARLVAYRLGDGEDRAVRVRVDLAPARGGQPPGEGRRPAWPRRPGHVPRLELGLPAVDAGDDVLVGVPDARPGRARSASRCATGQVGQGELEPRAPRLRVEDAVAGARRSSRSAPVIPGGAIPTTPRRRLEPRSVGPPDRQQGDRRRGR